MNLKSNKNNNQSSLIDNQLEMPSTPVENIRQIRPFLSNKPNFKYTKINVSSVFTQDYENLWLYKSLKNKPNSKPIQSQFWAKNQGGKAKTKPIQTQFY